jgi:hypothetical protein
MRIRNTNGKDGKGIVKKDGKRGRREVQEKGMKSREQKWIEETDRGQE